jgi:phage tail sheath protein FI
MPVSPTYPGVYLQELQSGVHTIAGVSTSVTAFVGVAARGPVNVAKEVLSFADYERTFGGLAAGSEMSYGVRQFFVNGGSVAFVVRVAPGTSTASLALKDSGGINPSLVFSALDGGAAGNGTAVAVDYGGSPGRFNVTLASVPGPGGAVVNESYAGLSMNRADPNFVESAINGQSALVTVARDPAAVYGKGSSTNGALAAWPAIDATHNTLQVSVDGGAPRSVTFPNNASQAAVVTALNGILGAAAVASNPSGNVLKITSSSTSDTSSVIVLPGLTNDAAKTLAFGAANGGIEVDGSATARPIQGPSPGTLAVNTAPLNAVTLKNHADGAIVLTLDGGRPATIGLVTHATDITADWNAFAAYLTAQVNAFNPAVPAFKNFSAAYDGGTKILTLTSGTRGPASSVAVAAAPSDPLATDLGLPGGTQTNGTAQILGGGNEVPLSPGNVYGTFVPAPSSKGGIYALENVDLFNLLCLPGVSDGPTLQDSAAYCEQRRAFLIVDPPQKQKPTDIETLVTGTTLPKSDHAAIYYPNFLLGDPLTGSLRLSAPSGTIAGIFARTDSARGVWKAPAGTDATLIGAQGLEYTMTDGENGIINPVGANAIRNLKPYGIISWGARTLKGADAAASDYKYVPVRRLALFIEESLYRGTKWVVFEPNDEPLWGQIRLNVGAFMNTLFRQGAFAGASPRNAYFVACDKTTTTQNDVNLGQVNIIVGFAPLKPAEFVIISIQQMAGQIAA